MEDDNDNNNGFDAGLDHLITNVFGLRGDRRQHTMEALANLSIESADELLLFTPDDSNLLTGIGLPTQLKFRRVIEYLQSLPVLDRDLIEWTTLGTEILIPTVSGTPSHAASAPPASPQRVVRTAPPIPTVTPSGGPNDVDSVLSTPEDSVAQSVLASVQRSLTALAVQHLADEAQEFRKGIKRSKDNYKDF